MRLINCRIQNVRTHSDFSLEFSPRITLIGGANETGKSTLVDALHRVLFLKSNATGYPIEFLRSKTHLGHPTVELKFEAKGEIYTLKKCFSGSSGQISLSSETTGNQLFGSTAEDNLATLLGVKEIVGSRQANKILPTRWAHIWVMQGTSGSDLLQYKKENYDFDSLLLQLEKTGGAVIQQSADDQVVCQKIDSYLAQNFTSRGIRKNSPLWKLKEELREAEISIELASSKQAEFEDASDNLDLITKKINRLQTIELPKLAQQKSDIVQEIEEINELTSNITFVEKELEPFLLRYKIVNQKLNEINQLQSDIKKKQVELSDLKSFSTKQESTEIDLLAKIKSRREVVIQFKEKIQKINKQRNILQLLLDKARNQEMISRLVRDIENNNQYLNQRISMEKELSSFSDLSRTELNKIRHLKDEITKIEITKKSISTGIKLRKYKHNQKITINGDKIKVNEIKQFCEIFEIKIGEEISIEIRPGGLDYYSNLNEKYLKLKKELSELLLYYKIETIEKAEDQFQKRIFIKQQLKSLESLTPESIEVIEVELLEWKNKNLLIEDQLLSIKEDFVKYLGDNYSENKISELSSSLNLLGESFTAFSIDLTIAEGDLEIAQKDLHSFNTKQANEIAKLKVIENLIKDREKRLSEMSKENNSKPLLMSELKIVKQELDSKQKYLDLLKSKVALAKINEKNNDLITIDSKLLDLQRHREEMIVQKGILLGSCDSIGANDPYSCLEAAKVRLQLIQSEYNAITRKIKSHQLLQDLFLKSQTDLSIRYTEPLAKSIEDYLKLLKPKKPQVKLNFDQTSGFNGLELRRGEQFYSFENLSGGMKEQLSLGLRLSMADLLKLDHNGTLPLIFDDAFTNSDLDRIPLVRSMLLKAADSGLQIILLTCQPSIYQSFSDTNVLIS